MKSAPGPMEIPNWQSQIIKTNQTVSNQAAVNTGGANPIAIELYNMDKRQRQQIAVALKSAGYRVPTNGTFSDRLLNAYNTALQSAQLQAAQIGQQFSSTFFTNYLANEAMAYGAGTGAGGTSITEQESVITEATAKDIINKVFKDQLGRSAKPEEIAKYTTTFQKKAKNQPTVTTSVTKGKKTTLSTQPGFTSGRAEQYLVDKVAGTDEAKANKVLSFYETAMKVLAGE
jgi:hypothetical protein